MATHHQPYSRSRIGCIFAGPGQGRGRVACGRNVCQTEAEFAFSPRHPLRRNKITLMEEITHSFLNHRPTAVTLQSSKIEVRDYDARQEAEAYGSGAAALLPWPALFRLVNTGTGITEIAARFDISEELVAYRIKITGAYRLFLARQRRTA